jgi:hypothetical protein
LFLKAFNWLPSRLIPAGKGDESILISFKSGILVAAVFLLLSAFVPLIEASYGMSTFYVKIYANPYDSVPVGQGQYVMGNYVILDFIQWGNLTAGSGNHLSSPIGKFTWHVIWVMDQRTVKSVIYAQFTMSFDSGTYAGKTIKGTAIANITRYLGPGGGGAVEGGIFVGNGDLNVAGHIEPVEVGSAAAFIGYSW